MFSSCRATCPSSPRQGTWTTAGCRVTSSLSITPRFQAGNSVCLAPAKPTWTRTWTRNWDKFYHVFSSYRATCPSSPGELGQGTWTTAGCRVTSSLVLRADSRQAIPVPRLSLEGVFQMASILPERLPALVRPAFDLVLRRIQSLKRCVLKAQVRKNLLLRNFALLRLPALAQPVVEGPLVLGRASAAAAASCNWGAFCETGASAARCGGRLPLLRRDLGRRPGCSALLALASWATTICVDSRKRVAGLYSNFKVNLENLQSAWPTVSS